MTPKKHFLINKEQQAVCDFFIETLETNIKQCPFSDFTQTCIPQYDSALSKDRRRLLQNVKMSALCQARVETLNSLSLRSPTDKSPGRREMDEIKESNLLAYRPAKDQDSVLLNDL
jgi:hypothetical protein